MKRLLMLLCLCFLTFSMTGCKCKHEYVKTVYPPTCQNEGYTEYVCSKCGDSYQEDRTEKVDHEWIDATLELPKRCKWCGLTSGDPLVAVPNLVGCDEATAKTLLAGKGLVPRIENGYSNEVNVGNVIKTYPEFGSALKKDSAVMVYICKGPSLKYSKDAQAQWNTNQCNVEAFYDAFVREGTLTIEIEISTDYIVGWKGSGSSGFGTATLKDSDNLFGKEVNLTIDTNKMKWNSGENIYFSIVIPLEDVSITLPTSVEADLIGIDSEGSQKTISLNFTITW